jgi:hypothetical protein
MVPDLPAIVFIIGAAGHAPSGVHGLRTFREFLKDFLKVHAGVVAVLPVEITPAYPKQNIGGLFSAGKVGMKPLIGIEGLLVVSVFKCPVPFAEVHTLGLFSGNALAVPDHVLLAKTAGKGNRHNHQSQDS